MRATARCRLPGRRPKAAACLVLLAGVPFQGGHYGFPLSSFRMRAPRACQVRGVCYIQGSFWKKGSSTRLSWKSE